MDGKRLAEWLGTADGLVRTVATLVAGLVGAWVAVTKTLDPILVSLKLPPWSQYVAALFVNAPLWWLLVQGFRRFSKASRLERPDHFTLRPTDPGSLIGRSEDLERMLSSVKQYRLVLLDGESGCGKSALVNAGLVPRLREVDGLLPVVLRDWGEDWIRGPLSATLEALYTSMSEKERKKLGWVSAPDLAADTGDLCTELRRRLASVFDDLQRRPLLVADQFDDYQARHPARFLDEKQNWLAPTLLASSNVFWGLMADGLKAGRLHLMVITRRDTAGGLACVRFLNEEQVASRSLLRVDSEYLRPLLVGVARSDPKQPVVSNPESGWHDLIERLEADLKLEGAILMQQVRTLLLGLRQLPLLTPAQYGAAGGLRGVETLAISRALHRAGESAGRGEAGRATVRAMLRALILPGGANQPPKARQASLTVLEGIVGDRVRTESILMRLQADEVVRPAEAIGGGVAWQLDHDYLARAVLAEERQANRWSVALREGKARYDAAVGNWRRRWSALLPIGTLLRVCYEAARGRLTFGESAAYARASARKPAALIIAIAAIAVGGHFWNQDRLLTLAAGQLVDQLGGSTERNAVLSLWSASEALRQRVYDLVRANDARRERAARSNWPLAHAALDPARALEAALLVRAQLEALRTQTGDDFEESAGAEELGKIYAAVAARLDESGVKAEAPIIRAQMTKEQDEEMASAFATAYGGLASAMTTADAKSEARALRVAFTEHPDLRMPLLTAYEAVAPRLTEADARAELALMSERLLKTIDTEIADSDSSAYVALAAKIKDQVAIATELASLRAGLARQNDFGRANALGRAYVALAGQLDAPALTKIEVVALRGLLEQRATSPSETSIVMSYSAVASQLADPDVIRGEMLALGTLLARGKEVAPTSSLATTYGLLATRINQPTSVEAAAALRARMASETDAAITLTRAYATVAAEVRDSAELRAGVAALRTRILRSAPTVTTTGGAITSSRSGTVQNNLAALYEALVSRMPIDGDAKAEAVAWRTHMAQLAPSDRQNQAYARCYAAAARRLNNQSDLKSETAVLRAWLQRDPGRAAFHRAYRSVATSLTSPVDVMNEVTVLRTLLTQSEDVPSALQLSDTYGAIVQRLSESDARGEARALREGFGRENRSNSVVVQAYTRLAGRLGPSDAASEASLLRASMEQESPPTRIGVMLSAYESLAAQITDQKELNAAAAMLKALLAAEQDTDRAVEIAGVYSIVAGRLRDDDVKKEAAQVLRTRFEGTAGFLDAYVGLVKALRDPATTKEAMTVLGTSLVSERGSSVVEEVAKAYSELATTIFESVDGEALSAPVAQILTLAAHPLAQLSTNLLVCLKPAAKSELTSLDQAVTWAEKTFHLDRSRLRPPLQ